MTVTIVKCSREADHHSSSLRKVDGEWVCQECWAKEQGIEVKRSKGRKVTCPKCGEVLMTRFRNNKVNVTSMSVRGDKAILICGCGYRKVIPNPFGGERNRDKVAFERLKSESIRRGKGTNGSAEDRATAGHANKD